MPMRAHLTRTILGEEPKKYLGWNEQDEVDAAT